MRTVHEQAGAGLEPGRTGAEARLHLHGEPGPVRGLRARRVREGVFGQHRPRTGQLQPGELAGDEALPRVAVRAQLERDGSSLLRDHAVDEVRTDRSASEPRAAHHEDGAETGGREGDERPFRGSPDQVPADADGMDDREQEGESTGDEVDETPRDIREAQPATEDRREGQDGEGDHGPDRCLRPPRLAEEAEQLQARRVCDHDGGHVGCDHRKHDVGQAPVQAHGDLSAEARQQGQTRRERQLEGQEAESGDPQRRPELQDERPRLRGVADEDEQERAGDGCRVDAEPQRAWQMARPMIRDQPRGPVRPDGGIQHGRRDGASGTDAARCATGGGGAAGIPSLGAFSPASGTTDGRSAGGDDAAAGVVSGRAPPVPVIPRATVRDLLSAGVAIVLTTISRIHVHHPAARLGRVGAAICTPFRHA